MSFVYTAGANRGIFPLGETRENSAKLICELNHRSIGFDNLLTSAISRY